MRIAVNTRLLLKNRLEGIGRFTFQTLKRITRNHLEDEFIFLFDRPYDSSFITSPNIIPVTLMPQSRHPFLWHLYFEYSIPYALHKWKPDVFLSTDGFVSLRSNVKTVNVIHDLNFEHHPEYIENVMHRKYYLRHAHKYAQHSNRIAAVSEFTKQDIIKTYGIPEDRIDVVYNAASELFYPISEFEKAEVRKTYAYNCPYFIFVGSIHKRKNLKNQLLAFDLFKERTGSNIKFIVVGTSMWCDDELRHTLRQMKYVKEIIFYKRMESSELSRLTAASIALMYASLYEGFGIPILEAFETETAVITSDLTAMPEIAGNAAVYCDPHSVESIMQAMQKLAFEEKFRSEMIKKGIERRQHFSWDRSAEQLWNTIEKVL